MVLGENSVVVEEGTRSGDAVAAAFLAAGIGLDFRAVILVVVRLGPAAEGVLGGIGFLMVGIARFDTMRAASRIRLQLAKPRRQKALLNAILWKESLDLPKFRFQRLGKRLAKL